MATLNGKELYIFRNYSVQIEEHASLDRVWNNVGNVIYINTDLDTIKKVDVKTVQNSIESMQKAIGVLEGLALGSSKTNNGKQNYEKRPMYKYFED